MPIAVASTLGNVFFGKEDVDFVLGSCIAAGLAPTVILGAHIVNKIPAKSVMVDMHKRLYNHCFIIFQTVEDWCVCHSHHCQFGTSHLGID